METKMSGVNMDSEQKPGDDPGLRIMVIDDEPIVCKRLSSAFQKIGHEVVTYNDSASALDRIAKDHFDIVVTDLKMEGVDGLQILTSVRAANPKTRVIMITGFATIETAKESFHKGAFDFVAKPFKLADIIDCVKRIESELKGNAVT
jgi:DNA-binding NtrC family response regulator